MPFILRIHSYCGRPLPAAQSRRFDASGGTIGRTPDNDLVLDDPDKHVSRKHAHIECRDGDYYYADLGSNASVINDLPLGKNNEAKLCDGDRILVGDYLLEAVFEAENGFSLAQTEPAHPRTAPVVVSRPLAPVRDADFLSDRSILYKGTLGELVGGGDPLGIGSGQPSRSDPLSVSTRGAQSDHVSPENQALAPADAAPPTLTIPNDYDPLADTATIAPDQTSALPAGAVADNEVLRALLRGLGVPALNANPRPLETAEMVGAMLREALRGTMSVLAARASTKREFHAPATMLAAQGNNPLKLFADVDAALTQMLTSKQPGYLAALKAIGLAFDDIRAHELALFAGVREALLRILARFDPVAAESQLKAAGALDSLLPANRKARLWDRQLELYAEVVREADDDFQRLFGERFAAAYEEQVQRVRARRERQP